VLEVVDPGGQEAVGEAELSYAGAGRTELAAKEHAESEVLVDYLPLQLSALIASAEGAVVLARAQQDIEPFEVVANQLVEQTASIPGVVSPTTSVDEG
jgi:uncharacterized protein YqeY